MKKIITFLNSLFITLSICIFSYATASPNNNEALDSYHQKAILAGINDYRNEHGLGPLKMNKFVSEEAKNHSLEMAENICPFGHDGFKDRMFRIFQQFNQPEALAENVAFTSEDAQTVIKLWLDSPGHRKNIEGDYNLTGIGIVHDKNGGVYVTQIFFRGHG